MSYRYRTSPRSAIPAARVPIGSIASDHFEWGAARSETAGEKVKLGTVRIAGCHDERRPQPSAMKHNLLPFVLFTLSCLRPSGVGAKQPSLPQGLELRRWFSFVSEVEDGLERGDSHLAFQMKKMHVHAKVLRDGEVIGAFRTETSSTCVDGEIATFNIARALGCGELFQPTAPMELRGKGLATLRQLMAEAKFPAAKEADRQGVLEEIANNPDGLRGGFRKATPVDAVKYHAIEVPVLPPNGGLNEQDRVAVFLKSGAPQPGKGEIKLKSLDCRAPAASLSRELSDILLVDALAGQWDRFSGGNLHVVVTNGRAHFLAVDNGGANLADDLGYMERFKKWVTRFDRRVVAQLFALESFLDGQKMKEPAAKPKKFLGFNDEQSLASAMGMDDPRDWNVFKGRVREVAAHVRSIGEQAYFSE